MSKSETGLKPAYFEVQCDADNSIFIIELVEADKIAFARKIVSGAEKMRVHVLGVIEKKCVGYNPQWSFHLIPKTIEFFESAIEVCDATPSYVEEHLEEVGGPFLPSGQWCPWCSKVVREVPPNSFH